MNYTEIKQLALNYADREDAPVVNNMDNFIQMVESRINKSIKVGGLTIRTTIITLAGQEYYGLPEDYSALRDIEIQDRPVPPATTSSNRQTLEFYTPKQFNDYVSSFKDNGNAQIVYTVIAGNQLQIYPPQEDKIMEIVYHQKLIPLNDVNITNWVAVNWPEVYLYGLLTEINSFVKDGDAFRIWDDRFREAIQSIKTEDDENRWSGTQLRIREV